MRSRDEDGIPPLDLEAERDRLDAALLADSVRLNELDADIGSLKIERVEVRVRFGTNLDRRLEITLHGDKGRYVREMARVWGFEGRTAHHNRWYARLYQDDPNHFNFAFLANLTVAEVLDAYRDRLGNERAGRIADRRQAQAIDNAVEAAALIRTRQNQTDQRRLHQLRQQGIKQEAFERWTSAVIFRRGTPLPEEERGRGLSKLLIDSGAYTASTQDIEINIDEYCEFLIQNPWITPYVNLDNINPDDPEDGAHVSHQNFRHMRQRGLNPIPVFHAGEDFAWLRKYIFEEGSEHIGLGGVAGSRSIERNWAFFDQCFAVIEKCGRPIKTHAFGVAHEATLLRYPFASADAASWLLRAQKFGSTDVSRLGGRAWRASLNTDDNRRYAARTFLEALDANRFERQVRETREFDFYLSLRPEHPWWFPALWTVSHRHALVSYRRDLNPNLVQRFINDPWSVLTQRRYAASLALLEEMKARYTDNLHEQARRQRERDRELAG